MRILDVFCWEFVIRKFCVMWRLQIGVVFGKIGVVTVGGIVGRYGGTCVGGNSFRFVKDVLFAQNYIWFQNRE